MTVDELQVLITANSKELQKEINEANKKINSLQKTANKTSTSLQTSAKSMSNGVVGAFKMLKSGIIALGIGKVIKDSITTSMNAVESDSLFDTSLGAMADDVRSWSEEMSNALGLNAVAMRKNTGTIFNMTSSMGLAEDNALKMSKGISLLTEDMASFYNLSSDEAFNKLRAGLTGETEPLKALGILVDENTVKQVAYQQGIATTGSELTQQQKVLARYIAILQQTGNAQGDLARTINSPANQLRILKNQVSQLGLSLGNLLIPILSAVIPYITAFAKVLTLALNTLAKFLGITNGSSGLSGMSSDMGDISAGVEGVGNGLGGVSDGLDDANKKAKKLKGTLAGFDEMNVLQDNSSDSSSTGSSGGSVGGGVGGVGGLGGDLGFELGEYEYGLDGLNSKVDEIVGNIKSVFGTIGTVVKDIWSSEPVQAFAGAVASYGQFIWNYWSQMGTLLYENITMTWGNIETNVGTTLTNMTTLWTQFWTDIDAGIQTWGQPIIDGVTGVFDSIWKDAVDPYIQLMSKKWADFSGMLVQLWDKHGKPLVDNIGEFVVKTTELFQSLWDNIISPIVEPFLDMLNWLWDEHLKDLIYEVGDFIGELVNGALEIYNKFIQPIVNFLLKVLSPQWSAGWSLIIGVLGTVIGVVVDFVTNAIKTLKGIIQFVTGVFTGDWDKAWEGIKNTVGNIFGQIEALAKGGVNLIIDALNAFIAGLNKIKWDLPDWDILGDWAGKRFGFDIPKIKKLAKGGIVTGPTPAIIGEAGKEAVLPLENNLGYLDKLAEKINSKGGNNQPTQIVVKLGEETIYDKFIEYTKEKAFETNGEVFSL